MVSFYLLISFKFVASPFLDKKIIFLLLLSILPLFKAYYLKSTSCQDFFHSYRNEFFQFQTNISNFSKKTLDLKSA